MKQLTIFCAVFLFFLQAQAQQTLTIDYTDAIEPIERVAAGFLHPFSNDGTVPDDSDIPSVYDPLNITYIRTRDVPMSAGKDPNAIFIHTLGNVVWGTPSGKPAPWSDWTAFETAIRNRVIQLRDQGFHPIYDAWNEPDAGSYFMNWSGASYQMLFETYKRIHDVVRATDPLAQVSGIGYENINSGISKMTDFVDYCKANNCIPDIWNWHFGGDNLYTQVTAVRSYCLSVGVHDVIGIFEYLNAPRVKFPCRTAYQIAMIEEAEVDIAIRANWGSVNHVPGSLCGTLIYPTTDKRGTWWVYNQYGKMTGERVNYSSTTGDVKVLASIDNASATSIVIIGNKYSDVNLNAYSGNVNFTLNNIEPASGTTVHVTLQEIPYNNHGVVNSLPNPVIDQDMTVSNNAIGFTLDYSTNSSAYKLTVTNVIQKGGTTTIVDVTGVSVSPTNLSLEVGQSSDLTETISPSNASNQTVSWSTSNAAVATVNSSGLVTAIAAGSATITATTVDGGFADNCAITVEAVSQLPGSFNLLSPGNNASVSRNSVNFDWQDAVNADSYTLKVDANSDFSSSLVNQSGINTSSYTTTPGLSSNTTYYWKVTAVNGFGSTDCNAVFSFKTTRGKLKTMVILPNIAPEESSLFKIYPNPSSDMFTIETSDDNASISITDLSGKLVYSNNKPGNKLLVSTEGMKDGIYIVTVNNGSTIECQKLMVK
jgi:hypothetical protein